MKNEGCNGECRTMNRRALVTRTVPACAIACLGLSRVEELSALIPGGGFLQQETHRFDVPADVKLTPRQRAMTTYFGYIELVRTLQDEMERPELLRLLNVHSAKLGTQQGERQAQSSPDRGFQTFVRVFRPPNFADLLTHEVVVDTEKVFQLSVKECLAAETIRGAGLDGEIGHAMVCNMDYNWPIAFNRDFRMERSKTLMQGHDECNHRYLNTA